MPLSPPLTINTNSDLTSLLKSVYDQFGEQGFSIWGMLYKHGSLRKVAPFTAAEKAQLKKIKVMNCRVGNCIMNAQRLALNSIDADMSNITYVEGLVTIMHGFPIDHAWVEINGKVYDPTLFNARNKPKKTAVGEYYGIDIDKNLIRPNQLETGYYTFLSYNRKLAQKVWGINGQ